MALAQDRDESLSFFLGRKVTRGDPLFREKWGRPDWVKSALNNLLDYAPNFGDDYLLNVLVSEQRWLGDGLHHDDQWNQRLLDASKRIKGASQAGSDDLLSRDNIVKYEPLYSRLLAFPDGAKLLRDWCRKEPNTDWLWHVSMKFHESDMRKLLSEPVLTPELLNQLIASVTSKLSKKGFSNYRGAGPDLMLSLVFKQAGRPLSTPRESLLLALCVRSNEWEPMMSRTLGVMVRDESVRLDKGRGWENRLTDMKKDPLILKELLKGNRLSLDESDKNVLRLGGFIMALEDCHSPYATTAKEVKKSELIDAYVDSFGVPALQQVVSDALDCSRYVKALDEDIIEYIRKTYGVEGRTTLQMVRERALNFENAEEALLFLKKIQRGEKGYPHTVLLASHIRPALLLSMIRENISEIKYPQALGSGLANGMKGLHEHDYDFSGVEEVMELVDRLQLTDEALLNCIEVAIWEFDSALSEGDKASGRCRKVEDWLTSKKVAQIGGTSLLVSAIKRNRNHLARWLLVQESVRAAGFEGIWASLFYSDRKEQGVAIDSELFDEMVAIEKDLALTMSKGCDEVKTDGRVKKEKERQKKDADGLGSPQMEMDGFY